MFTKKKTLYNQKDKQPYLKITTKGNYLQVTYWDDWGSHSEWHTIDIMYDAINNQFVLLDQQNNERN